MVLKAIKATGKAVDTELTLISIADAKSRQEIFCEMGILPIRVIQVKCTTAYLYAATSWPSLEVLFCPVLSSFNRFEPGGKTPLCLGNPFTRLEKAINLAT